MSIIWILLPAATTCQQSSTAAGIVGLVVFLGLVAGVIALAVLNSDARRRLAAANAELSHLRPEYARLHQWMAGAATPSASPGSSSGPSSAPSAANSPAAHPATQPTAQPTGRAAPTVPPQWSPDPSGRHQLRYWDGTAWSHHVADGGLASIDPAE
jgi:hypothetical protein